MYYSPVPERLEVVMGGWQEVQQQAGNSCKQEEREQEPEKTRGAIPSLRPMGTLPRPYHVGSGLGSLKLLYISQVCTSWCFHGQQLCGGALLWEQRNEKQEG
jgi:hypothetical protein